jgi:hypothetical protein
MQTPALQVSVTGSQYWAALQFRSGVDVVPSALHVRTPLAAQKRSFGVQTCFTQLALVPDWTQLVPMGQGVIDKPTPLASQRSTFVPLQNA